MYVTCEQCRTTYRLDDGLVKKTGTKVRCSRCKFIFRVFPQERTDQISRIVSDGPDSQPTHDKSNLQNQFTEEDLKYLQEKASRIENQRSHFDTFIEEGGFSDRGLQAEEEQTDSFSDRSEHKRIESEETESGESDTDRLADCALSERDPVPAVPILDDDFESPVYDKAHYPRGGQEPYEWDAYDFEPDEFDENIGIPEQEAVDTDKEVPGEDRAFQMAMEIGEQYGWGYEKVKLLAKVFREHGWSLTRTSILHELERGMTFDEFQLAVDIRRIWHSHSEFSIGYCIRGSFGDDSLKYRSVYENPDWPFCLKIIRKFESHPDPVEIEQLFLSLYTIWKFSPVLQDRHMSFYGFIRDIVESCEASLDMLAWRYSHYGEIESDYPNGW